MTGSTYPEDDQGLDELMGELRVVLPGAQVLFAFLLTVPFSSRFDSLPDFERAVYLVAFLGAAAASVLLIAPSALRQFLRHEHRHDLQPLSARLAIAGLAALGIALIAVVNLICDMLYGVVVATVVTVAVAGLVLVLWFAFPLVRRAGMRGRREHR